MINRQLLWNKHIHNDEVQQVFQPSIRAFSFLQESLFHQLQLNYVQSIIFHDQDSLWHNLPPNWNLKVKYYLKAKLLIIYMRSLIYARGHFFKDWEFYNDYGNLIKAGQEFFLMSLNNKDLAYKDRIFRFKKEDQVFTRPFEIVAISQFHHQNYEGRTYLLLIQQWIYIPFCWPSMQSSSHQFLHLQWLCSF